MSHHREPAEELFGKFFPLKARWVFPALLGFLALLFLLAWLIRYPDVTSIRVLLRKEGRVERYYAETPRRVAALPVENGQSADSGAVLLVWETGAGWEDIAALGRIPLPNDEAAVARVGALELGELEAQWALAWSAWEGYRSALETARAAVLAPALARQLAVLADMESALRVQAETRAQEAELAKRTWERSQRLAKEDAVSLESVAAAEAAYLEKKAGAGSVELELQRVGLQREALEQEQLETALLDDKDLREKKERWEAEWRLLVARSGEWTRRNLILSVRP